MDAKGPLTTPLSATPRSTALKKGTPSALTQQFHKPELNNGQMGTTWFSNQPAIQSFTFSATSHIKHDPLVESAIDDDDEGWEDESPEDSGSSTTGEGISFERVDPIAGLPSHR
ncbi:hypothetical protein N657DRAFT_685376 [Parathielavia appendiculata]|uniref:DUF3295 domain-containing protein n=1 Tax=Parathielavia appendiculata TaxID=2587402 RepID=A0AAN6TPE6_9PEZI|nr:hypothetical protein N657DRAFT_685376 [Parathielavia appendiculata]